MFRTVCLLLFFSSFNAFSQEKFSELAVITFQNEMNDHFRDSVHSPLLKDDLKRFKGLDFYPANEKYFVVADFVRTKRQKPFEMKTTTNRKPMYVKYGEVHFMMDGKKLQLNVYQNVAFGKKKDDTSLFLPFTDNTCGEESYGGGRYLDLEIPEGKHLTLNFNKAYNPYCAYNPAYSCPIVPTENHLDVNINAGVKKYHD